MFFVQEADGSCRPLDITPYTTNQAAPFATLEDLKGLYEDVSAVIECDALGEPLTRAVWVTDPHAVLRKGGNFLLQAHGRRAQSTMSSGKTGPSRVTFDSRCPAVGPIDYATIQGTYQHHTGESRCFTVQEALDIAKAGAVAPPTPIPEMFRM